MTEFTYREPFPLAEDTTEYELLSADYVRVEKLGDRELLVVQAEGLALLAERAMHQVSFFLRPSHQEKVAKILEDPEASENDRFVALTMLHNSVVAAKGQLPTCQDTGTATIRGGEEGPIRVWTECAGRRTRRCRAGSGHVPEGTTCATRRSRRYLCTREEHGDNLPAQIDSSPPPVTRPISSSSWPRAAARATSPTLYQQTKALLNAGQSTRLPRREDGRAWARRPARPTTWPSSSAAPAPRPASRRSSWPRPAPSTTCPPAAATHGQAFRDPELEERSCRGGARDCGIGAQFGGKYFALDVRVIRLPRHGASCPVGMGVSCSADRNIKAKINRDGIWLEQLDENPGRFIGREVPRRAWPAPQR